MRLSWFLAAHPLAGAHEGNFFVDSYGEMLYQNLGLADKSVLDLVTKRSGQGRVLAADVFHQAPAQEHVLEMFSRAPYVVLDGRALKQLTPETLEYIQAHSQVLKSASGAELRVQVTD